jgi:hypothetical protein
MLSETSAFGGTAPGDDFVRGRVYETMTAELLTYKRQRDIAREKGGKYKQRWREVSDELRLQSEKFELLAGEFRRIITLGVEEKKDSRSRSRIELKGAE